MTDYVYLFAYTSILGVFLVASVYHFVLFIMQRNSLPLLLLGFTSLAIAFHMAIDVDIIVIENPYSFISKIFTSFLYLPLVYFYSYIVFLKVFNFIFFKIVIFLWLVFGVAVWTPYYEDGFDISFGLFLILIFYHLFFLILRRVDLNPISLYLFLMGLLFLIVSSFISVFASEWYELETKAIAFLSLALFILTHSCFFSYQYCLAFYEVENFQKKLTAKIQKRKFELNEARKNALDITIQNETLRKNETMLLEKEWVRIGKEIHDGLNSALIGVKWKFSRLEKQIPVNDPVDKEAFLSGYMAINDTVSSIIKSAKNITKELRPDILDSKGLVATVELFVDDMAKIMSNTTVKFSVTGNFDKLDENIALNIFRIVQEALINAFKYSNADLIEARLSKNSRNFITLTISDNGVGFDESLPKEGLGLVSMRERAIAINGSFGLETSPQNGSKIIISVDLNE